MEEFLRNISQKTLVTISLICGVLIILFLNPVHSVCDSQLDLFKKDMTPTLFPKKYKSIPNAKMKSSISKAQDQCIQSNNSGGCLQLFDMLRSVIKSVSAVPTKCTQQIYSVKEVKTAVVDNIKLIVILAWGSKPPENEYTKYSWFDYIHLDTYCSLKDLILRMDGVKSWERFRETIMEALPGYDVVGRDIAWKRSILSYNCKR